jgi:hypothetical protein
MKIQLNAQTVQEKIPLKQILLELEDKYGYRFNYIESTVSNLSVIAPSSSLSFLKAIEHLRKETNLVFDLLGNNFISVKKRNLLSLCGYLKDNDTEEPLIMATIQGKENSTISDETGYFEITINSLDEEISIRFLGYKIVEQSAKLIGNNSCKTINLIKQTESLPEVVLSNYLVEGIDKVNASEYQIDFSKLNILPGLIESDVLQATQALPGVQSINETVSNINIRGGTHDQNLILWDGIKMYQSGHFFGLISVFNPQITQKVTLSKNGTSSEYSDGISGTISMHSDKRINKKINGSIGGNLIDGNAFIDLPLGKKSSVQIAARKSMNDLVTTPTYTEYFNRISQDTEVENNEASVLNSDQHFDFYDSSVRLIYTPSNKDYVRLNFININNKLIFTENATIENQPLSRESSISQNSIGGGVFYKREWNENFITLLQIYESDYKLKAINANLLDSQRFLQENSVSETGIKVKSTFRLSNALDWHMGYQFIETKVTNLDDVDVPLIRTLISEVVRTHAGFAQLDFESKDQQTYLSIGLRYNYLDKFKKQLFEPRLSFNQGFAEHFNLEVAGEFKHQITTQVINFQNDFLGVEKRRWQLSNNVNIPVLKSKQGSIGLSFNKKGWLVISEVYYKQADGITSQSQGFQNQYEFIKTEGHYNAVGLDFLIRKRIKNMNLWISYSIMQSDYTFETLAEQQFPSNLNIKNAATIGLSYKYKAFKVSTGFNWHTGKPTTRPILGNEIADEEINYQATNSDNLEDYFRLDASALYNFNLGKININVGASVWNILDQENTINNYYRINENKEAEEFAQNALGLTPNAMFRAYF